MASLAYNFKQRTTETGMKYLEPMPTFLTVQSIEYHWLTGKVTRVTFRKADEIIELMDGVDERGRIEEGMKQ